MYFYWIRKISFISIYFYTVVKLWIYMFGPAVAVYGFWPMIGTSLVYLIVANVAFMAFMFTTKPQATYKKETSS